MSLEPTKGQPVSHDDADRILREAEGLAADVIARDLPPKYRKEEIVSFVLLFLSRLRHEQPSRTSFLAYLDALPLKDPPRGLRGEGAGVQGPGVKASEPEGHQADLADRIKKKIGTPKSLRTLVSAAVSPVFEAACMSLRERQGRPLTHKVIAVPWRVLVKDDTPYRLCWADRLAEHAQPVAATARTHLSLPQETTAFLRAYRKRLKALHGRWDLRPVGVSQAGGAGRPLDAGLEDMYQPLRLGSGYDPRETNAGKVFDIDTLLARCAPADTDRQPPEEGKEAAPRSAENRPKPLVIRGAAGAGKTTWMRYTFRRLLLDTVDALPMLVVMRDVATRWRDTTRRGAERSLDAFLDSWVAEHAGGESSGQLRRFLAARVGPQPVLLVDGWDELGPLGEEFREKLLGFMEEYPHVQVVVSSRPYGEGRPSASDGFEVLDIQPLSNSEIKEFTDRFFRICYGTDEKTRATEVAWFCAALKRTPEAAALAQTALLLTMMLLISRAEPLPEKRHLLYEKCVSNLLTALPERRAEAGALLPRESWRPEDSEYRKQCLASLAHGVQTTGPAHHGRSISRT
jgi:hypothetical protein